MTPNNNSRRSRAAARNAAAANRPAQAQQTLVGRLRRMSADVEQLQAEIGELEALLTESAAERPQRPRTEWQPTPEPQPWLVASTA